MVSFIVLVKIHTANQKKHCNDRCHIITGQPPNNGHLSTVATFLCPQVAMLERFNCICLSHVIKTEYSYYFAPWLNNNLSLPDECNYMNSITVSTTKLGSTVASWLVRFSLDQAIWISTVARDTVLCSLLSQRLSPPRCINGY